MSQRQAQLFQIAVGQMRKQIQVDIVTLESIGILFQPVRGQPSPHRPIRL
jgi:hypothetical protein